MWVHFDGFGDGISHMKQFHILNNINDHTHRQVDCQQLDTRFPRVAVMIFVLVIIMPDLQRHHMAQLVYHWGDEVQGMQRPRSLDGDHRRVPREHYASLVSLRGGSRWCAVHRAVARPLSKELGRPQSPTFRSYCRATTTWSRPGCCPGPGGTPWSTAPPHRKSTDSTPGTHPLSSLHPAPLLCKTWRNGKWMTSKHW